MRVACLFSGGKDSVLAAWVMRSTGWDIACLLTLKPARHSMMFHHPNTNWCGLQAKAMNLKHSYVEVREGNAEELEDLEKEIEKLRVDGVCSGALASEYQKERIDAICEHLGLRSFAPLWHINPKTMMRELVESDFEIIVSSVSADGLEKEWLGRRIDKNALDELDRLVEERGIHPAFEGGEAETFVLDAPFFKKKIKIEKSAVAWDGIRGEYNIEKARLVEKKYKR